MDSLSAFTWWTVRLVMSLFKNSLCTYWHTLVCLCNCLPCSLVSIADSKTLGEKKKFVPIFLFLRLKFPCVLFNYLSALLTANKVFSCTCILSHHPVQTNTFCTTRFNKAAVWMWKETPEGKGGKKEGRQRWSNTRNQYLMVLGLRKQILDHVFYLAWEKWREREYKAVYLCICVLPYSTT